MDEQLLEWIARNRTAWLDDAARALMNVGTSPLVMALLVLLGVAYVVTRQRWQFGVIVAAAFMIAATTAAVLKAIIGRPRPTATYALVNLHGFAMPSTHAVRTAALTAAVLGAAKWLRPGTYRNLAAILVTADVVVGAAMVYLGGHWLTDVLVGWLIGGLIGAACAAGIPRLLSSSDA